MGKNKLGNSVLFVDDELNILKSIERELREEPFEILFADNGKEALNILYTKDISLIVTDLKMPEMDGIQLLKKVKESFPDIIRIIITGVADVPTILGAIRSGETHRFITKPLRIEEELIPSIYQCLELYNLALEKRDNLKKIVKLNKTLKSRNEEIAFLRKIAEQSNEKKNIILANLRKEITPFVNDVLGLVGLLEVNDNNEKYDEVLNALAGLKTKSDTLHDILREIEDILVKIEFYR